MRIVKHNPSPIVPPPTFDIIGLSYKEAVALKALVGWVLGGGPLRDVTDRLYRELDDTVVSHADASAFRKRHISDFIRVN